MKISTRKGIRPLLKWPGGKEKELKIIQDNLPIKFSNFYDPFVGGGSVFVSIDAKQYFVNDRSDELINFYRIIKSSDKDLFFDVVLDIDNDWKKIGLFVKKNKRYFEDQYISFRNENHPKEILLQKVSKHLTKNKVFYNSLFRKHFSLYQDNFFKELERNIVNKFLRMRTLEIKKGQLPKDDIILNIEASIKSAFYMHFRYIYNNSKNFNLNKVLSAAVFYFIRNYAYSGMFRYNNKGDFNVPYGGIGYNNNSFTKKIKNLKSSSLESKLGRTSIYCDDFKNFLRKYRPTKDDFMFLDPPYDTDFSSYAKNEFEKSDQERLAKYLTNECDCKWMLIIKHTDFIFDLYSKQNLNIFTFDKTYLVSFMNRNNKNTQHLLISNYDNTCK